ncbi:AAA family ATPase [Lichenibacterium minor]|uniref:AAA family ATPase n=1 Tax=Lichenibacterium minor TaxID=2316528 RepID=A0A4Q2U2E6_9HYPH|nr:AAA family ATPase [Lichenibacterium minor]RYC29007.1 AAA family ATPase [Lichenibacterium minor]
MAAIKEALRGIYGADLSQLGRWEDSPGAVVGLALVDATTSEDLYDRAITTGAPVVILAADLARISPPEACALVDRTVDIPPGGRSGFVERLIEVVTGDDECVSAAAAARLSMLDVMRCVQLGSTGDDCKGRIRALLAARDAVEMAKAPKPDVGPVPLAAAAGDVVRRLGEMTGFGDAGVWGVNLAADLRDYAGGRLPWTDVDRGVLISGPPGGGKTTFARALALECEVDLVVTTYTEWSAAGGTGDSMSKGLTKLFDGWRKRRADKGPFILFVDEIDSMGVRGGAAHNDSWFGPVINAWLAFLDGAVPRDGIVVIAATNHPERVDPALLRPGRLDRHLELPMPDVDALLGIVRAHLGPDAMLTEAELAEAARACRGRSPAQVGQLAREARRVARWCKRRVCASDLTDAVAMLRGPVDAVGDRMVSIHEAGHAVACLVLGTDELLWVDQDRGLTRLTMAPHWDERIIVNRMVMQLAARAAEELVIGHASTGCGLDLEDATGLAYAYHTAWGWGASGLLSVSRERALLDPRLAAAVRATLDEAYVRAQDLVLTHRAAVERVADALRRRRYLDASEVRALVDGPVASTPRVRRSAPMMGGEIKRTVGPVSGTGCT